MSLYQVIYTEHFVPYLQQDAKIILPYATPIIVIITLQNPYSYLNCFYYQISYLLSYQLLHVDVEQGQSKLIFLLNSL